ncbi:3 [Maize mosaic nucleorhabdovirus]|uniref:Putative movement protein 3 n=2 Tax=Maize mosaic virus TaxID=279896 RepID=MVP_MMVR|nr:3 [Maize mosaic nucleorhabdovirus] [Maize mosaic nucleorhabdovirus]Q6E0W9.1 RecName: Full=Putative movement protein 3; Short=MP; AltName: Full=Cell-to-cell transport protein; AltName: Full=Protein 3 [Maize mosaic virus maize/USA/Reed/2005]AAT66754.1 3 [Maize mosaic nucleorhabdovirus] [Maize mosaic nucleorhabdovirus]QCS90259.1 movement protein [Maize mosaic nucleorhabdovirus]
MEPSAEIPLGKGKETGRSPLIATRRKTGLVKAKIKTNSSFSMFRRADTMRTHAQFTNITVGWKSLCPITAEGQVNVAIYHESTRVPVLNLWSPVSSSWKHLATGSLGFVSLNHCPYVVEGRISGFEGEEAGLVTLTLHLDTGLESDDIQKCRLFSEHPELAGGSLYLYTSYTSSPIPDSNLPALRTEIDDTIAAIWRMSGGKMSITTSHALGLIATFRVKIESLLGEYPDDAFSAQVENLVKDFLLVSSTAEITRSYRTCLAKVLSSMTTYDKKYWDTIITGPSSI